MYIFHSLRARCVLLSRAASHSTRGKLTFGFAASGPNTEYEYIPGTSTTIDDNGQDYHTSLKSVGDEKERLSSTTPHVQCCILAAPLLASTSYTVSSTSYLSAHGIYIDSTGLDVIAVVVNSRYEGKR